jgi:hypothetical protein
LKKKVHYLQINTRCHAMKVLVDEHLSGRLGAIHEAVELRDAEGQTYGYFHPVATSARAREELLLSPVSNEELARRQAVPGGRPLAEIWKDLAVR